jgi:hypothetical protein
MITRTFLAAALLVVSALVAGCAPAYHHYPHGCVRYGYCPPPPLPLVPYPSCPVLYPDAQTVPSAPE